MKARPGLCVFAFVLLLSCAAPAVLVACGVFDLDLLMVVFLPSVAVGAVTGWYARRPSPDAKSWAFDSQRMP